MSPSYDQRLDTSVGAMKAAEEALHNAAALDQGREGRMFFLALATAITSALIALTQATRGR